jgi:hypothetical protein
VKIKSGEKEVEVQDTPRRKGSRCWETRSLIPNPFEGHSVWRSSRPPQQPKKGHFAPCPTTRRVLTRTHVEGIDTRRTQGHATSSLPVHFSDSTGPGGSVHDPLFWVTSTFDGVSIPYPRIPYPKGVASSKSSDSALEPDSVSFSESTFT